MQSPSKNHSRGRTSAQAERQRAGVHRHRPGGLECVNGGGGGFLGGTRSGDLRSAERKLLSAIREQRSLIEAMAQRPRPTEEAIDTKFVEERLQRLPEIENSAGQATNRDDLNDLISLRNARDS